jgi:outer membrane lipopolysaccharide assembly protein LptE/RlpB
MVGSIDFTSVILGLITLLGGCGWVIDRKKYRQEVESLRADNRQKEMNLSRAYVDEFHKNIVKPLEVRVEDLTNEVNSLKSAIEKVNDCPYRDNCPVRVDGMRNDAKRQ